MTITTAQLKAIDLNTIESAYSGRPGCMCGCRGNHRDTPAGVKRVYQSILRAIAQFPPVEMTEEDSYYFIETDTRYYALYKKRAA